MRLEENKDRFLKYLEGWKSKKESSEPKWPYELFGIECGDGWKHLYEPIIDRVMQYNEEHSDNPIEIHQIKEKYGGLCVYLSHYTDELTNMIDKAEDESYHTCELCGKHIDKPINEGYWIYAECKECHDKWKKDRIKKMNETYKRLKSKDEESID